METITNGETIDGKLDTRTKDARENDGVAPTKSAGDPACSSCGGAGVTRKREGMWLVSTPCACARRRQLAEAIQRCWPADVIKAARFKPASSILVGKTTESLWIRAEREVLAAHLARALPELGKIELVRIASDADLATAWLARAGDRVRDDEVREAMSRDDEDRFERLVDLAAPPALLIVQLGVRISKLDHLPDLVLESIEVRRQRGRPTWVVDTDARPLAYGHRAYRQDLAALLAGWPTVRLNSTREVGEVDVELTAEPHLKRRADPELLAAAEADGIVPKSIGKGGSVWGDCNVCGTPDSRGYVRNDFGRVARVCRPCKTGKTAKMPPEPPAAQSAPLAQDAPPAPAAKRTAKDALRAALGIGGSPVPVYPSDLEAEGWSKSSLEKALKELRREHQIEAQKQGGRWVWMWST